MDARQQQIDGRKKIGEEVKQRLKEEKERKDGVDKYLDYLPPYRKPWHSKVTHLYWRGVVMLGEFPSLNEPLRKFPHQRH